MHTTKTLMRLGGCPGCSESLLGAHVILLVFVVLLNLCLFSRLCFHNSEYVIHLLFSRSEETYAMRQLLKRETNHVKCIHSSTVPTYGAQEVTFHSFYYCVLSQY